MDILTNSHRESTIINSGPSTAPSKQSDISISSPVRVQLSPELETRTPVHQVLPTPPHDCNPGPSSGVRRSQRTVKFRMNFTHDSSSDESEYSDVDDPTGFTGSEITGDSTVSDSADYFISKHSVCVFKNKNPVLKKCANSLISKHSVNVSKNKNPVLKQQTMQIKGKAKTVLAGNRNVEPATFSRESDDEEVLPEYNSTHWTNDDLEEIQFDPIVLPAPDNLKSPRQYWNYYFDDTLLDYIVEQTNLYSVQNSGSSVNTNKQEVRLYFAIIIYMGICPLSCIEDYWSTITRVPQIADLMSSKRFMKLKTNLHFCDNSEVDGTDRLFKVRYLLDHMRRKCQSLPQENYFSIDESMVPYKGKMAGNLRQYIKNKPHKWGFKFFVLAGKSGMVYDFLPYVGSDTFNKEPLTDFQQEMGLGAKVVVSLCKTISLPRISIVHFDNFFTSLPLLAYLKDEMYIHALGTIRQNRMEKCPLLGDEELLRQGRGACDFKKNQRNIVVVKWADRKVVTLASTFAGVEPKGICKRNEKKIKEKLSVPCPRIVSRYNQSMGGVDLFDMLTALYRVRYKGRKWYSSIIAFMLDFSLVNSWSMYMRECKLLHADQAFKTSKEFRLAIYDTLSAVQCPKRGRPSDNQPQPKRRKYSPRVHRPNDEVRQDKSEHWPRYGESQGRCRNCVKGFTSVLCAKCNVRLCFTSKKNCFECFHTSPCA